MKRTLLLSIAVFVCIAGSVSADTFGTGDNQFNIDFVLISGDASSANGTNIGIDKPEGFIDPGYNYRMGTYEVTNDQWGKFMNSLDVPVTGSPAIAYNNDSYWMGTNVPTNFVSWYEGAQFVNWLNTSTGSPAAYKFTGTQGTSDYTLGVWESGDTGYDASNPYRNSNAIYFLPTEDEWVKAAYWNGTNLQTWATLNDTKPVKGVDARYGYAHGGPWDVGSGSEELNGTYDMMGNLHEWMENPYYSGDYLADSWRGIRGGAYWLEEFYIRSVQRDANVPTEEFELVIGLRVASVPEPCSLALLGLGGLVLRRRRNSSLILG